MSQGRPTRPTWRRALAWQLHLFVQVLIAIVASSLPGAAAYLRIYGVEELLERLRLEGFWIEALQRLKGGGFFPASGACLVFELMHLTLLHLHGWPGRKDDQ